MNGTPIAPARKRMPIAMWLHSSKRAFAGLDVMAHHLGDAPQDALAEPARDDVIAGAGGEQQVAVARDDAARAGEPSSAARISAQIIPIGVRDIVLPPMPTVSPSCTSAAASSSDTTFSAQAAVALRQLLPQLRIRWHQALTVGPRALLRRRGV